MNVLSVLLDVIAVCKDVGDIFKFTAKTSGKELTKRDVTLVDRSGMSVSAKYIVVANIGICFGKSITENTIYKTIQLVFHASVQFQLKSVY